MLSCGNPNELVCKTQEGSLVFQGACALNDGGLFTVHFFLSPGSVSAWIFSSRQSLVGTTRAVLLPVPRHGPWNPVGAMVRTLHRDHIFDIHSVLILTGSACPCRLSLESELLLLLVPLVGQDYLPLVCSNNLLFPAEKFVSAPPLGQTCPVMDTSRQTGRLPFSPISGADKPVRSRTILN